MIDLDHRKLSGGGVPTDYLTYVDQTNSNFGVRYGSYSVNFSPTFNDSGLYCYRCNFTIHLYLAVWIRQTINICGVFTTLTSVLNNAYIPITTCEFHLIGDLEFKQIITSYIYTNGNIALASWLPAPQIFNDHFYNTLTYIQ